MNNVFSTAYHWNPITGAMPFMAAVSAGKKIEAVEADQEVLLEEWL